MNDYSHGSGAYYSEGKSKSERDLCHQRTMLYTGKSNSLMASRDAQTRSGILRSDDAFRKKQSSILWLDFIQVYPALVRVRDISRDIPVLRGCDWTSLSSSSWKRGLRTNLRCLVDFGVVISFKTSNPNSPYHFVKVNATFKLYSSKTRKLRRSVVVSFNSSDFSRQCLPR